jgi:glucose-1-phosphate cytidylyltransferase
MFGFENFKVNSFEQLMINTTNDLVDEFIEKPKGDGAWINGGFFVLSPKCIDYIKDDQSSWEGQPLLEIAKHGQLAAYKHNRFWQPMDTLRDKNLLEDLWVSDKAPWKIW